MPINRVMMDIGSHALSIRERKKTLLLMIRFEGKSGNILRDMESFPDMPIDIIYQVVGRSDWYYAKSRIELTAEELRQALYRHTSEAR